MCVSLCVMWLDLRDDDDDNDEDDGRAWRWAASSFLCLQEPYTSVQSEDQPLSMTLGSALHQRLCQQGLFRGGGQWQTEM